MRGMGVKAKIYLATLPFLLSSAGCFVVELGGRSDTVGAYRQLAARCSESKRRLQDESQADLLRWQAAEKSGTKQAYKQYLRNFPRGKYRREALRRIDKLDWEKAKKADTTGAYRAYLRQHYRDGKHRKEAKERVEKLLKESEQACWEEALRENTISSYEAYLRDYKGVGGKHVSEAVARMTALIRPFVLTHRWKDIGGGFQAKYHGVRLGALPPGFAGAYGPGGRVLPVIFVVTIRTTTFSSRGVFKVYFFRGQRLLDFQFMGIMYGNYV